MVLAICSYLDRYFLASTGNTFYVCGFPNDNPQRVRKFVQGRTHFLVASLTVHFTRIAIGDCRDSVLFYSYHEDTKRLEQLYSAPSLRLVADCILMDAEMAVIFDRKGCITDWAGLSKELMVVWLIYLDYDSTPSGSFKSSSTGVYKISYRLATNAFLANHKS
ncbi:hypothetical protein Ahy_A06g028291 isoform B [Arachis hypogaea]|uniref:RSE1/DDB1/CPSF1 C-terminal domain-containing protein n=1 Tax=Arachis hypogaea TaxID=3818 RepID=A0A445CQU8_ARAHY|nr:hypothetical protein Ahy_A06g028291 isoform B [Arachis hypogaea]